MGLRNLPANQAVKLADLITCKPGQISSMGLTTHDCPTAITLLAFSDGEDVSEETYASDMLYYAVEGSFVIVMPDARIPVTQGEALAVPAGMLHAVENDGAFKVLQIAVG